MSRRFSIQSPLQSVGQRLGLVVIILLTLGDSGKSCMKSDSATNTFISDSWTPIPRNEGWWETMHEEFVLNSQTNSKKIKIIFFGDSITQGWFEDGNSTFQRFYGKRGAANYGINSDRTQHLLWRIKNGELDKIHPKIIVLLIGTNNLSFNKDTEIFLGVKAIVQELRRKLPRSKILLLGILPRNNVEITTRVNNINKKIMQLDDSIMIWYFDLGKYFYIEDRFVTELYQPDLLHLSSKGYEIWGFAMETVLKEMLEIVFEPE